MPKVAPRLSLAGGGDAPATWTRYETEAGDAYLYNPETGESVWEAELPEAGRSEEAEEGGGDSVAAAWITMFILTPS